MTTAIPIDLAERHIAVVGMTGSGKSYASRGLIERLIAAGRKVCVIDPTGVWWGLRADPTGSPLAHSAVVIAGGEHADVELSEGCGAALADAVRGLPGAFVIDCSEMTRHGRTRLLEAFFEQIYRNGRGVIHLVVDEADEFMPQNPLPETRRLHGAADRIVRRGRAKGFRCVLITQRPAVLHKNVLSQAETLVAMRLKSPQDRAAIQDWIKGQADLEAGKAVIDALPTLQTGEGFIWAPDHDLLERIGFGPITTYDSGRAPSHDEEVDEVRLAPAALAEQLRGMLAPAAPEQAPQRNDDTAGAVPHPALARVQQALEASQQALAAAERKMALLEAEAARQGTALQQIAELIAVHLGQPTAAVDSLPAVQAPSPVVRSATSGSPIRAPKLNGADRPSALRRSATGGRARMLAELAAVAPDGLPREALAIRACIAEKGGTFQTYLARMKAAGEIEERDGLLYASVTCAGQPTPFGDRLAYWAKTVGGAGRLLRILVEEYPGLLERGELARRAELEVTGGTFGTYLGRLRSRRLIQVHGAACMASPLLMSEEGMLA